MSILKEGYPFIFPSILLAVILAIVFLFSGRAISQAAGIACLVVGCLSLIFGLFCCFFFRDPKITITDTKGNGLILSPCNGTVMEVCDNVTEDNEEKVVRVFLSIFSVHLQRSPVSGTVTGVRHKDGKFLAAWDPRAHIENEQNIFTIRSENGSIYTVRQIAGLVARRCVSWVKEGDVLEAGDKIGMIKFSSQVDLHLPATAEVIVKPGDKTQAGITIMAKIK